MPAEFESGVFRVEYPIDVPWHGLGTFIDPKEHGPLNSKLCLELAELDWKVELMPNYLPGEYTLVKKFSPDTKKWEEEYVTLQGGAVPNDFSVVRQSDNKILGKSVGPVYRPIQNELAFQIMDSLVEEGVLYYESAGSLRGGELVWMLARVATEPYKVKGVDPIVPYLLGTNAHNGQRSFRVLGTATRVVCANTLSLALHQGRMTGVSVQHSGDVEKKAHDALRVFAGIQKEFEDFTQQAEVLASYQLSEDELVRFTEVMYPSKGPEVSAPTTKKREELSMEFVNGDGERQISEIDNTAWDLFNAVTRITNHSRPVKVPAGQDKDNETHRRDARLDSLWFGSGNEFNQKALTWLMGLSTGTDPDNILRA